MVQLLAWKWCSEHAQWGDALESANKVSILRYLKLADARWSSQPINQVFAECDRNYNECGFHKTIINNCDNHTRMLSIEFWTLQKARQCLILLYMIRKIID